MKLITRVAVALVLCSAAFITSAEAQAGAAKQKEDPCAALARFSGIGKDSSAAIARCINKGSGQVPVGEYLVAKSVIITKPKASLSTAGVAPDSPRCSGKLPCARFQRAEKFRSGSMFAFSGKGTAIRHVVFDGAQELLAAPLQQKGSLVEMTGCIGCSLKGAVIKYGLGTAGLSFRNAKVEVFNALFLRNGSPAAATDAVAATGSVFGVSESLFINTAGLSIKSTNCRGLCRVARNVVTYDGAATRVPAAMLLRGSGYEVIENVINCPTGGCARGIVTDDKRGNVKAADANATTQSAAGSSVGQGNNLLANNVIILQDTPSPQWTGSTSLLASIALVIHGGDRSSAEDLVGQLLAGLGLADAVAQASYDPALPPSPYNRKPCRYSCFTVLFDPGRLGKSQEPECVAGGKTVPCGPPCTAVGAYSSYCPPFPEDSPVPSPEPTPTVAPSQPIKDACSPGEKESCFKIGQDNIDKLSACRKEFYAALARACYYSERCQSVCGGTPFPVKERQPPTNCNNCLERCEGLGATANHYITLEQGDELRELHASCETIDISCPKTCRYPTSKGDTLNCCDAAAPEETPRQEKPPEETAGPVEEPVNSKPSKDDQMVSMPELMQSAAPDPHT